MLVLTRRPSESIIIANNIKITVVSVGPGRVKLGIEAPPNVRIDRQEIHEKLEQASDVLSAVAGGELTNDAQNTMLHGPDTATIVIDTPTGAPSGTPPGAPTAPPAPGSAPQATPPLPPNKLNKFRFPRKPR
jgi:carbon storage regulator